MPKKKKQLPGKKTLRRHIDGLRHGDITLYALLAVVIIGAIFLGGYFGTTYSPAPTQNQTIAGTCCDSGDGNACQPQTGNGQTFTYNGQQYGLLKTGITLKEAVFHMKDTGQKFNGNPIIVNSTDEYQLTYRECGSSTTNQVWGANGCIAIPKNEVIYVCTKNCGPAKLDDPTKIQWCGHDGVYCYGGDNTVYDAYFRLSDYPSPGVPDVIKNCVKTNPQGNAPGVQQIVVPNVPQHQNLQLSTFKIVEQKGNIPWLSPYCKPAIYLYPTQKTDVSVKIAPRGNLTLTIPQYPQGGWDVTAYPNGKIVSGNKTYPYLYYEAQIPDNLLNKEKTGYAVAYKDLPSFFANTLPKLGLNSSEQHDFAKYWLKALPKSPYYKINIVPESLLNTISPLLINPAPNSVIRVTLYFTPLSKKININPPVLPHVIRSGFTVVEWGGLYKKSQNHPFTCMM